MASIRASHLLLVIALASVFLVWGLGSIGLTDRDEGRNAEAGREMFETGDAITPTFNYEPRFIKPAMLYWLMSVSYRAFGENEFAARFPSALFGVGLIALLYLFLTHERGPIIGLFGAVMLLLNVGMVASARQALTDMVLIFFTTLATFSFWLGFHGKGPKRRWLWVSYIAMACGTLTKGPVGFLVPLLAVLPYLTVTKQWKRFWQHGFPLRGLALYLALALPWYAVMLMLHGSSYSSDVQTHTVSRFLNPFYGWGGTVLFYVPVLLWGFFPWSAFLPVALYEQYKVWKGRGVRVADAGPGDGGSEGVHGNLELFAGLWLLAVFILFSLGATRLPHYIGPLYPAAAIVAASYWARASQDPAPFGLRVALWIMIVLGVLLALAFAALPSVFDAFAEKLAKNFPYATHFHFDAGPYVASVLLLTGMTVVGYLGFSPSRRHRIFWAAGTTIALVILIMLHLTLPQLSRYFLAPPQELAFTAGLSLEPADRLIFYGPNRPSAVFYAKRKVIVVRLNEEENIGPHIKEPGRTMIVLPAWLRDKLPEEASTLPVIQERFGWILLAENNRDGESLSDHAK
jgi:4-amino-4-deoxy-L-arabinose transferase-like glycosyltransferase